MIGYVMVGTNNLDRAINFYDEVLQIINLKEKILMSFVLDTHKRWRWCYRILCYKTSKW